MRGRVLLWMSLGANAALAAVLWHRQHRPPQLPPLAAAVAQPVGITSVVRTNVVVRRQNFVWSQIESEDYPTYVANLRAIGCPESTLRDIIVAEVNQLFARRRDTEIATPQQQWWKSDPDSEVSRTAAQKTLALDRERRDLLARLLGPDWESAEYPYPQALASTPLNGPILGNLAPSVKTAVQQIERESLQRQEAYLEAQRRAGREADPAELARLRQQTRDDLARVLPAEALEEFLLRYSNNASTLRSQLRGLTTTPEEFRALFRALDSVDAQLQQLTANDTANARRRQELEQQRQNALKDTLGPERYQEYVLNQEPLYRQAQSVVEQSGASPDKLLPLAAIYRLTELELQRIRTDDTLTTEEKAERLQATRQVERDSLRRLLGDQAYQRYLQQTPP